MPLLHGWVVDPQDEEIWGVLVEGVGDYDAALERIVEGEEVLGAGGEGEDEDEEGMLERVRRRSLWTPEQERKVREGEYCARA